eukprot:TRINITY_DN24222_c0_g1_i1.p1 TRINITY_DN24222_c0_g1~~TRINITY_DN24222_c0_g1_i1.p1  ORF type:complete len:163 (-),score=57.69 TRINITY_DN24222_c0_g1_i1:455-943(-)
MERTGDENLSEKELERQLKDRKWEHQQVLGLTSWVNSYLKKSPSGIVDKLPNDFQDGVKLCEFLNLVTEDDGRKVDKFINNPKQRIQKIENASKALKFITGDLAIRLVGIGAEDIVDGEMKLILGLLWSSFRKLAIGNISGEGNKKPEDDLLNWIREMTKRL